jgi:hypothetical protein
VSFRESKVLFNLTVAFFPHIGGWSTTATPWAFNLQVQYPRSIRTNFSHVTIGLWIVMVVGSLRRWRTHNAANVKMGCLCHLEQVKSAFKSTAIIFSLRPTSLFVHNARFEKQQQIGDSFMQRDFGHRSL